MESARRSLLGHDEAMALQRGELDRIVEMLAGLDPEDWIRGTECPGWDIRTMFVHVLGACDAGASVRENGRQMVRALRHRRRAGGPLEAALSFVQIEARNGLTGDELVDRLRTVAPRCIRGRARTPGPARQHMALGVDGPVVERWTLGYLVDTIYLRDMWMHRMDAARALGTPPVLSVEHDGRIVADVVEEWWQRLGRRTRLELTGPAGGSFGDDGDPITLDAVDFCRRLAGRSIDGSPEHPDLDVVVPF